MCVCVYDTVLMVNYRKAGLKEELQNLDYDHILSEYFSNVSFFFLIEFCE